MSEHDHEPGCADGQDAMENSFDELRLNATRLRMLTEQQRHRAGEADTGDPHTNALLRQVVSELIDATDVLAARTDRAVDEFHPRYRADKHSGTTDTPPNDEHSEHRPPRPARAPPNRRRKQGAQHDHARRRHPGRAALIRISTWIWLIGTTIAVVGALVAVSLAPSVFTGIALAVTLVQAALAIPAALMLPQRKRWARTVLLVLALLSLGSLYSALQAQAWPTLVLNLALASTFGLLQDPSVREYFGLPREQWLNRKLRGTGN